MPWSSQVLLIYRLYNNLFVKFYFVPIFWNTNLLTNKARREVIDLCGVADRSILKLFCLSVMEIEF